MPGELNEKTQGDLFAWRGASEVPSEVSAYLDQLSGGHPGHPPKPPWSKCPDVVSAKGSVPPKGEERTGGQSADGRVSGRTASAEEVAGRLRPIGPTDTTNRQEDSARATGHHPTLRPYQLAAIAGVRAQFEAGARSTLLVLPTGTGKTVVFAELARQTVEAKDRVLVLAHRTELLEQAARKLADVGIRASLDQGASRGSHHASVVVGSVQTLRGARLERHPVDAFGLVVVDEAHHAPAASYKSILGRFTRARVLGVTATPDRGDGKALAEVFSSVAFSYEMRAAIREKYLAPLRARRVTVAQLDLRDVKSHHGDFDQAALAKVLSDEKALHGVVSPLVQLAGARRTLVFGVDVAHAHALTELLNRHREASAIALDGSASRAQRAATISLFRQGRFQFLVNCALFTEGFDEPSIECIAMARPTQSRALYTQMLGRGTRLSPETGKLDCLVLDFVGNSRHRLIGPADALAGVTLDEAARDEIEASLDGKTLLEDVLAVVEAQADDRAARVKLIAIAHYKQKEIDVFLGNHMPPIDPNSERGRSPATDKQLAALEAAGMSKPPAGFTLGEASAMLDAIAARRRAGLATVPQCRLLEKLGIDTRGVTVARAGQLIGKLKVQGFKPYVLMHEPEARRGRKAP